MTRDKARRRDLETPRARQALRLITWGLALAGIPLLVPFLDLFVYPVDQLFRSEYLGDYWWAFALGFCVVGIFVLADVVQIARVFRPHFPVFRKPKAGKPRTWPYLPCALVGLVGFAGGIYALGFQWYASAWYRANPYETWTAKAPYLSWTDDPATTVTITWETELETPGRVQHGPAADQLTEVVDTGATGRQHCVHLAGLPVNQVRYYSVDGGATVYAFRTAPRAPGHHTPTTPAPAFRFVAYGDNRYDSGQSWGPLAGDCQHTRVVDQLLAREAPKNFSFVLNVGDVVMHGGNRAQWSKFFREIQQDDLAAERPYMVALGNHEYYRESADGKTGLEVSHEYLNFEYSGPGPSQSLPGDEFCYWFNYSNALFVCLNTQDSGEITAAASAWFNATLDAHAARYDWVFVAFHYPIYSSAQSGGSINRHLVAKVENACYWPNGSQRVDFILTGHRHTYERLEKDGLKHHVLAGGGAHMDGYMNPFPEWTKAYDGDIWHYATFDVAGPTVTFTAIDVGGRVFDSATYTKA